MSEFPVVENVPKLKVAELKEELEKRDLPTSGLKKDLVTRLEEAQGFKQPPQKEGQAEYPEPPPAETKGPDVDHAEPADTLKDAAVPPKDISDSNPPAIAEDVHPEKEVGHVMVEGSPEKTVEIRELEEEAVKSPETKLMADLQPAALDPEVAAAIAEEEVKDTIPPSPGPVRSLSPVSVDERIQTPPLDDVLDLGEEETAVSKKRTRDIDLEPAPKRPRRRQFPPLPESLNHLTHPPTTCIYISNLRRPLLLPALHEYLFPDFDASSSSTHSPLFPTPRGPFASDENPNVWLSGVKSHAYAVFDTVDQAVETVKRIDGKQFPEETGGELKVDFVDEDEVPRLLEEEEKAWANGRQKMDLKIVKEEEGYRFDLTKPQSGSSRGPPALRGGGGGGARTNGFGSSRLPPIAGRPLTGVNALPARGGPLPRMNGGASRFPPRGGLNGPAGGRGLPPHLDRSSDGPTGSSGDSYRPGDRHGGDDRWRHGVDNSRRDRPGGGDSYRPDDGNGSDDRYRPGSGADDRRTAARPNLSWREGPPRR